MEKQAFYFAHFLLNFGLTRAHGAFREKKIDKLLWREGPGRGGAQGITSRPSLLLLLQAYMRERPVVGLWALPTLQHIIFDDIPSAHMHDGS